MGQYIPMAQGYRLREPCRPGTVHNDGNLIGFGLSIELPHEWRLGRRRGLSILGTSGKNNLLQGPFFADGCNSIRDLLVIAGGNYVAVGLLQKVNDRHRRYPKGE